MDFRSSTLLSVRLRAGCAVLYDFHSKRTLSCTLERLQKGKLIASAQVHEPTVCSAEQLLLTSIPSLFILDKATSDSIMQCIYFEETILPAEGCKAGRQRVKRLTQGQGTVLTNPRLERKGQEPGFQICVATQSA